MTLLNRLYDGGGCAFPQGDAQLYTDASSSPEMVRLWSASAVTLGLLGGKLARCGHTRCLNLMLTYQAGCPAACGYCAEAKGGCADLSARAPKDWLNVPFARLLELVREEGEARRFQRLCIAATAHPGGPADARILVRQWRQHGPAMPISVLLTPGAADEHIIDQFRLAGVDNLNIALDVATEPLFEALRGDGRDGGPSWRACWQALEHAAVLFGRGHFGVHLVVGLGESEQELLSVVDRVHALGGSSRLYAFRPEPGSRLVHRPAVARDHWRRIQLARFLIDYGEGVLGRMSFDDEGRLVDFGVPKAKLNALIAAGTAFRTSGCRGPFAEEISACDRPWLDSPAVDIASFPFQPGPKDLRRIRRQLGVEG